MKAIDRQFTKIVNGTTQFVIPVFQRDYSWTDAQCGQLWEDVVRVGQEPTRSHFMGSVVYIAAGDTTAGFTRWLLIDGQQRMTTITLLLLALRNHLDAIGWKPQADDDPSAKKLTAYFLRNNEEDGDRQFKLVLRRHDQEVLCALLDGTELPTERSSRVLDAYEFFSEKLASGDVDPRTVYAGVGRLFVVDVMLDRTSDDPQLIFESLNSTGMDLSQADLIRNFILMRVSEREQTRLYDLYWSKIDGLFRGASRTFDAFARDYLALKTRATTQARAEDIYYEFRHFFRNEEAATGVEASLAEFLRFARYHAAFGLGRGAPSPTLQRHLDRLNRLAEVSAVLVMRLYDLHERVGTLSASDFAEALDLLESYVFRRAVCGMQTRGYWQVFSALAHRLDEKSPLSSLKGALARQRETYRFPKDAEFLEALKTRDIYNMRNVHFLLDRLENFDTKEPSDTSRYSVEHVLPQNEKLPKPWRDMLGPQWQAVRETWLHRLGNLTLTGYNSTYSDKPFAEKKAVKGGFGDSAVRLNKSIREANEWTATEIEKRGEALAKRALKVWPALNANEAELKAAAQRDLLTRAAKRSVESVAMSDDARALFDLLRPAVMMLGEGIIEVAEHASISYHAADADFFLEIIPRKRRLTVLLNLDPNECIYRGDEISHTDEWKFIVNAANSGGTHFKFESESQLRNLLVLAKQAYELAAQ